MTGNRDSTGFACMLELPVATLGHDEVPTVSAGAMRLAPSRPLSATRWSRGAQERFVRIHHCPRVTALSGRN